MTANQPTKPYHDMRCAWYPIDQAGSPFDAAIMAVLENPSGKPWASCIVGHILDNPATDTIAIAGVVMWLRAEGRAWSALRRRLLNDEAAPGAAVVAILDELRADKTYDYVRISL